MDKPDIKKLAAELLQELNQEDPNWIEEAQDRQGDADEAAEDILIKAGYTDEHELWDDLLDELRGEVSWVPGHYAKTVVVNLLANQVAELDIDAMEDADELRRALLVIKGKALEALASKEGA